MAKAEPQHIQYKEKEKALNHSQIQDPSPIETKRHCRRCGAEVDDTAELCPNCMHPLQDGICSFCGAKLEPTDLFCPECGGPIEGISCPECGTLNFRNFCYKCQTPVSERGQKMLEEAMADPLYQEIIKAARDLSNIEKIIHKSPKDNIPAIAELSKEDKKLVDEFRKFVKELSQVEVPKFAGTTDQEEEKNVNLQQEYNQILPEYKKKTAEIQDLLNKLAPPSGSSPQIQRDYFAARKLHNLTTKNGEARKGWICNFCGCFHTNPEACIEPWHGGKWKYLEVSI